MYVQQLYTNCLAQAAYYIECDGEAAVVDPLRNPEPYIQLAKNRNAKIKYVLETHFHADFVSGHIDLANKTGATIVFGPDATPGYRAHIAVDGEKLKLGKTWIDVLHTPGHTIESACYLLHDEAGKPTAIFTGDTLFIGDVGRPDLFSGNLKKEELAAIMFRSLNAKIKTLADDIIVYPGHGAGSACGKNLSTESQSTIGHEKQFNYALKLNDEAAFITAVTTDQPVIPGYFFKDATINKNGSAAYDKVFSKGMHGLSVSSFNTLREKGATVIDTRKPLDFATGFVPGAINIGLNGDFAIWVGTMVAPDANLLIVAEPGKEKESLERLARIGFDNIAGYLQGGMEEWLTQGAVCDSIDAFTGHDIDRLLGEGYELLDVRNRREAAKDHIAGSKHIPLNELAEQYETINKSDKWLIYCAGGYRSMIAASFLKARGFMSVASVEGGINQVRELRPELIELGLETE